MDKRGTILEQLIVGQMDVSGFRVGHVLSVSKTGEILVSYPDNVRGPLIAKLLSSSAGELKRLAPNSPVLLGFLESDVVTPIIMGVLLDRIAVKLAEDKMDQASLVSSAITVDGDSFIIEGKKEIILHCGKASIRLRKDGKITVKGSSIVSRSSGRNKIRGSAIDLN